MRKRKPERKFRVTKKLLPKYERALALDPETGAIPYLHPGLYKLAQRALTENKTFFLLYQKSGES